MPGHDLLRPAIGAAHASTARPPAVSAPAAGNPPPASAWPAADSRTQTAANTAARRSLRSAAARPGGRMAWPSWHPRRMCRVAGCSAPSPAAGLFGSAPGGGRGRVVGNRRAPPCGSALTGVPTGPARSTGRPGERQMQQPAHDQAEQRAAHGARYPDEGRPQPAIAGGEHREPRSGQRHGRPDAPGAGRLVPGPLCVGSSRPAGARNRRTVPRHRPRSPPLPLGGPVRRRASPFCAAGRGPRPRGPSGMSGDRVEPAGLGLVHQ